jgi:hypothetical protein
MVSAFSEICISVRYAGLPLQVSLIGFDVLFAPAFGNGIIKVATVDGFP